MSWQRDFLAKTLGILPASILKELAQRMVLVRSDEDLPEGKPLVFIYLLFYIYFVHLFCTRTVF